MSSSTSSAGGECSTALCGKEATVELTWMDDDEPSGYCERHAEEVQKKWGDHLEEGEP